MYAIMEYSFVYKKEALVRKILSLCMFLLLMVLPMAVTQAASSEVTDVRWVTRNDAAISYVRVVLDLTKPSSAEATIDSNGTNTEVVLKNTAMKDAPKKITMDPKIAKTAEFVKDGKDLRIKIQTPTVLEENDVKVFRLKKDAANNKPDRLVIDIAQKNVQPRTRYYGMPSGPVVVKSTKPFSTTGGLAGKVIAIDPGHGGSDPGAIGANGTMEKNITMGISEELRDILTSQGAKVVMTRTKDVDVYGPNASGPDELQARANIGNGNNADLFISVHINSFTNPSVGGISAYYYDKTVYDEKIASSIENYIGNISGFGGDRGVQPGNLYVLRKTDMPATLLELGFISNPKERALLEKKEKQHEFAELIAKGIRDYFQG